MYPLSGKNTNLIIMSIVKNCNSYCRVNKTVLKTTDSRSAVRLVSKKGHNVMVLSGTLGKYTQETAVSILYVLPLVRSVPAESPATVSF